MTIRLGAMAGAGVMLLASCVVADAAVTISSAATSNMTCTSGVCTPTAANAVLNVGDLTTMLGSGNVTVNTGTGSLASEVEDIVVDASFSWANASSLTLDAHRSITVEQPVAVNGSAPVTLTTNDGGSGGHLSFIVAGSLSFLGTDNSLTVNGTPYALVNTLSSLASAVAANPSGAYAFSAAYDANHDGTYSQSPVPTTLTGLFEGLGNTISNISVKNNVKSNPALGGVFAEVEGMAENIRLAGVSVKGSRMPMEVGGLVGLIYGGTVFGAQVTGSIQNGSVAGGVAGLNENGYLYNSYAIVTIDDAGGGGLVGQNTGTIDSCFAAGNVTVAGNGQRVGGLVGWNDASISNSYARGNAKAGINSDVGGLIGADVNFVEYSYSTGSVTGGENGSVGGFAGLDDIAATDDYWDTTTSGTDYGVGGGNIEGLTGLTSKQLQSGLPTGFDPTIWAESSKINGGFPYLIANPPPATKKK
ncbi:MAG: GLUG motif-containing protein [Rhizomicrobium sp.]|jgi:hypothetical protein